MIWLKIGLIWTQFLVYGSKHVSLGYWLYQIGEVREVEVVVAMFVFEMKKEKGMLQEIIEVLRVQLIEV